MNTLTKLSLTALAISTIAGCASAPIEPPKTEAERIATGSRLHVPVAINLNDFTWHKVTVRAKEKDSIWATDVGQGTITIFTDKATGKSYDFEGQPVTVEGYRVLTDGYVCVPRIIGNGMAIFGNISAWDGKDSLSVCKTNKSENRRVTRYNKLVTVAPAVLSGPASIAALGYLGTTDNDTAKQQQEIEEIIKDDINS